MISVAGAYFVNGGKKGKYFVERFISIQFVMQIRYLIFILIAGAVSMLIEGDNPENPDLSSLVLYNIFLLIMMIKTITNMKDVVNPITNYFSGEDIRETFIPNKFAYFFPIVVYSAGSIWCLSHFRNSDFDMILYRIIDLVFDSHLLKWFALSFSIILFIFALQLILTILPNAVWIKISEQGILFKSNLQTFGEIQTIPWKNIKSFHMCDDVSLSATRYMEIKYKDASSSEKTLKTLPFPNPIKRYSRKFAKKMNGYLSEYQEKNKDS